MNLSKLITLAAMIALISTPLFFASTDAEAATTGKSSKSSKSKSKSSSKSRTHRLTKKSKRSKSGKTSSKRSKKKSSRNKTVTRTTTTRSNGRTTVSRTTRAQHGSNVRRRTVVRHNTGHHVGSTRTRTTSRRTVVHRAPRTRTVVHHHRAPRHKTVVHHHRAPRHRTVVHHHRAPRRTVVHHHENHVEQRGVREQKGSPIDFYVNGGLGVNTLHISDVRAGALSGTNYRVAVGGKGELFGIELGMDGGSFLFDDGTSLSVVGANVDFKAQPSFGMLEPYGFIGVGGYALQDNVFQEDAGSAALRAGFGADVRVNNVGIGAKYTWAGYNFQNDQSYVNVGATTQTLSGNLSFYF